MHSINRAFPAVLSRPSHVVGMCSTFLCLSFLSHSSVCAPVLCAARAHINVVPSLFKKNSIAISSRAATLSLLFM